mmetsp:Transcript_14393/g.22204  ORF Transcript_14393/g.22204 Transcript_14393/m.22204 type:complete len:455 (-) Transcript_14393:86-1450(-)
MGDRATSFPILKNSVILQIMEEVEIPLTESELIEPGRCKERIREVFARLLMLCWGMTNESSLSALPSRLTPNNNNKNNNNSKLPPHYYSQLYAEALPEIKFFSQLSKLMTICGNPDFGFKDLQAPTAKRLKRQLSAVINFLKFKEDMQCLVEQGQEEREELFAAMDEVTLQCAALEEELEKVKRVNQSKMLERDQAMAECKEMETDIAQQNRKQASIRQETYILKKNANELKDQIANLSISLRELQATERQLSKEVVDSPDRIKFEFDSAQRRLEDVKRLIDEKEMEREVVQLKLQNGMKVEGDVRRVMHVMEEMDGRVQEYEMVVEDLEDVTHRLEGAERALEEGRKEMVDQEKKLRIVESQKAETSQLLHKALYQSQKEVQAATNKLGEVEKDRSDGFARIEESQRRVQELESSMEDERKRAMKVVNSRIASFHKFEKMYNEQDTLDKIIRA